MTDGLKPYSEYKDPGVPWLGSVPAHWAVRRLGELGRLLKGVGGTKDDAIAAGVPCVRYGDLYTTHRYFIRQARTFLSEERAQDYTEIRYGDVLFAASGETIEEIGKSAVNLIIGPARTGGDVIVLRPSADVYPPFLGYATESRPAIIQKSLGGRGTTVKHIYPEQLKRVVIAFPTIPEQKATVHFLDHANARIRRFIRAKQKLIGLLQEQRQATIHRAVTRGVESGVRLKPSGIEWLGDVPEHWHMHRLKRLSARISGRLVYQPAQYFSDDGVPFIMGNNITPDGIRWAGVKRIPAEVNRRFAHHALHEGDVVTVRVGAPGMTCVVPKEADGFNCGSLMIIRRSDRFNAHWLAHVMNSAVVRIQIKLVQYGAAQEQINIEDAVNFWIPVPPLDEQSRIVDELLLRTRPLSEACRRLDQSIAAVREYRARLVSDILTGKLDVREAASRLPQEFEEIEAFDETDTEGATEDSGEEVDATAEEVQA